MKRLLLIGMMCCTVATGGAAGSAARAGAARWATRALAMMNPMPDVNSRTLTMNSQ